MSYAVRTIKPPFRGMTYSSERFDTPDAAKRFAKRLCRTDQSLGYAGFRYQVFDTATDPLYAELPGAH